MATCALGTTSKCTAAAGLISLNATSLASCRSTPRYERVGVDSPGINGYSLHLINEFGASFDDDVAEDATSLFAPGGVLLEVIAFQLPRCSIY